MQYHPHHIHLMSHDAMHAGRFYESMFGAKIEESSGANGLPRCNMHLGDQTILISTVDSDVTQQASGPHTCLGHDHIGLRVKDVVAAVQDLTAKGAKVTMQPRSNGRATIAFIEAPDGVSVELVSYE
ncbi:MAG: VOC family protein [Gammaproteobacteria bacterium]|nr:VOC family protein [Gammaproteobacteria bacterium]